MAGSRRRGGEARRSPRGLRSPRWPSAARFCPAPRAPPSRALSNPLGIPGTHGAMMVLNWVGWGLTLIVIALGAGATVVRLGRARGDERQQLKVVMTVGAVIALVAVLDMSTWFVWPHGGLPAADRGAGALLQRLRGGRRDSGPALPPVRRRRRHRAHACLRHAHPTPGRRVRGDHAGTRDRPGQRVAVGDRRRHPRGRRGLPPAAGGPPGSRRPPLPPCPLRGAAARDVVPGRAPGRPRGPRGDRAAAA